MLDLQEFLYENLGYGESTFSTELDFHLARKQEHALRMQEVRSWLPKKPRGRAPREVPMHKRRMQKPRNLRVATAGPKGSWKRVGDEWVKT